MKTIGLIGGMSWESTAVYYRRLNESARAARGGLASARVLLHSLDFSDVVALQKAGRWDLAAEMLAASARGLEAAGADCVLICTNTMHLVADAVASSIEVPLIDVVAETGREIVGAGLRRPLLLATRYTMEHGFYADRMERLAGLRPIVPEAEDRAEVHRIIFEELCVGRVEERSHRAMLSIVERGRAAGADSVILGCTEICLLLDPDALVLPGFDSTRIHADAASRFALHETDIQLRERKAA
ncbi:MULTISPECIES: aspartate/glutamate racemase family protein [unclassified Aureimonas]|uniref:aspartate/glutamate racemase family protein n=1 Tax=unclassified Aureimonas TaxID=2615206 RepID=UPI0006F86028|nr:MULTISPECIES: aspartate/glutamate racemase family protein [unclassified Aureimonas]KQT64468.1 aspartate racemase [Aureimonas sp. Leaf427]KQT81656.1 aspartate racemase [Aureimonas sp. Leaf460]